MQISIYNYNKITQIVVYNIEMNFENKISN
jgi:hypothetical protein